jgi:general secretion pathway protein I
MKSARGFTLIEILVAVAVLAIALSAIISGMARYADNASYLKEKTLALWVAHNRLTEIELAPTWPDTGKSDGTVDYAGLSWKWVVEVKTTSDDHLRRVDISVQRPDREGSLIQLSSFIGNP